MVDAFGLTTEQAACLVVHERNLPVGVDRHETFAQAVQHGVAGFEECRDVFGFQLVDPSPDELGDVHRPEGAQKGRAEKPAKELGQVLIQILGQGALQHAHGGRANHRAPRGVVNRDLDPPGLSQRPGLCSDIYIPGERNRGIGGNAPADFGRIRM